jgi:hypothetical protein
LKTIRAALALLALAGLADPALAQEESLRYRTGTIRVGDRILASAVANGSGEPCTVTAIRDASAWRPGYDGDFLLQCDDGSFLSSVPATGDHARPIPTVARAGPTGGAATAVTAVPARVQATQAAAPAPPATTPTAGGGNTFGTRDPQPCPRVVSKPSPSEAAQLVACAREGQSSKYTEYLVQDVRVTSMSGSSYDPRVQTGYVNMDTTVAPIAIKGSLVTWDCRQVDGPGVMAKYSNAGQNCGRQTERNATGYCYRLRTGQWSCSMTDIAVAQADKQYDLPPPR